MINGARAVLHPTGWRIHPLGRINDIFNAFDVGPLGVQQAPAGSFTGGRYMQVQLGANTVLYRSGVAGKPLGQWFDSEPAQSILHARIDKAILPKWPDGMPSPIDSTIGVLIPKGTMVYVGEVSYMGRNYVGGTNQIYVPKPWDITGVKVLSVTPLP